MKRKTKKSEKADQDFFPGISGNETIDATIFIALIVAMGRVSKNHFVLSTQLLSEVAEEQSEEALSLASGILAFIMDEYKLMEREHKIAAGEIER